jgi:putative hydroxymethylpyrimidine transport system substrate-binding protein
MRLRLALFALALTLSSAMPAAAQQKMTVLLDWFINPDHAPLIIAKEAGFFAKAGLDVSFVEPADPSMPPRLLAAGQGDIALTYQPNLYLQVKEGLPVVRVGTLVGSPLNSLVVRADGPVKSLADLKGRTIGYSIAGFEQALLSTMLGHAGVKLSDVKLVDINFALTPALLNGQVDAVIGAYRNFELIEMKLAGKEGRAFFPEDNGVPAYDELIYIAAQNRASDPRIMSFLSAVKAATAYLEANPDVSWKLFVKANPKLDDELDRQAWTATLPLFTRDPVTRDAARYARFADYMKAQGLIDKVEPIERYIGK